jgi:hypothetical protein
MRNHAPPIVLDTGQPVPTAIIGGQPLIQTVTIDDAMPYHILISRDVELSLMSL